MKTVPAPLQTILDGRSMQLCILMELTRVDATVLRLTDHDESVVSESQTFLPGLLFGPQTAKNSLSPVTWTQQLLLDHAGVTAADVLNGVYDNAEILFWLTDWSQPTVGRVAIPGGTVGSATVKDVVAELEVRSLADKLRQLIARTVQTACDADLGDARCGVNLAPFTFNATVTTVVSRREFLSSGLGGQPDHYFALGDFRWTSGANSGRRNQIKAFLQEGGAGRTTLQFAAYIDIQPGDGFTAVAGCDKSRDTCRDIFSNIVRHRGYPFVPGVNAILKTGGQ